MSLTLQGRRAVQVDVRDELSGVGGPLAVETLAAFEDLDRVYRSVCALLFNYVPSSGHPGGSISAGRIAAALVFDGLDYDLAEPERRDADLLVYAAGHKAMGLYALWALRNEIARLAAPELLPAEAHRQLRLEDLLGFRRNPASMAPLALSVGAKALDGHPTPATPFVPLATGASGVGVGSGIGLALAAADVYGEDAPRVHLLDGEGGLTPGRVAEALAAAGTAALANVVLHVDWNQSSIDSDRVCRESAAGDYVQWDPRELAYLHDWNVVYVPDGKDLQQVVAAQRWAARQRHGQPTAVVYRTVKGWRYGIEGRAAHGAGHKLCSPGFHAALAPLAEMAAVHLPACEAGETRCRAGAETEVVEACFWEALQVVRAALVARPAAVRLLAERLRAARERLEARARRPRPQAPDVAAVYRATAGEAECPAELVLQPGTTTTLRGQLGRAMAHLNRASGGALLVAAADLLGSTSVGGAAEGFPAGFFSAATNPGSRTLSTGGICEDAMSGILTGVSSFGHHLGVGSSYAAFLAPLGHVAARLHAIGAQARRATTGRPYDPVVLVCAHAGLKTGEDGPTHADPQALQLLQENFPPGTAVTLTPWEPQEIWPLLAAALCRRPALVAPFVTRPAETVPDRAARGLAPAADAARGVYPLRRPRGEADGVVVLQESGVAYAFVEEALPLLERAGIDLWVYYVASVELFDALPRAERQRLFPEAHARAAMGITGFTLPTMYRWVTSEAGRAATLHPFRHGHYLGSGPGPRVLAEAGLDGRSQFAAIRRYFAAVGRPSAAVAVAS
jgi:transketolase